MPEIQNQLDVRLPEQAIPHVLRSALEFNAFRVGGGGLGAVTASRIETGQVYRARKNVRFEFIAQWDVGDESMSDSINMFDEETWPTIVISLSMAERQNTWTRGRCMEELKKIVERVPAQISQFKRKITELRKDNRFGSARWASFRDLEKQGYLSTSIESDRLLVGAFERGQDKYFVSVPKRDTERHALICGPTGCGKTQSIFVPNLIERLDASAIITEATPAGQTPDLLKLTAAYRKQHGHEIFYFNPADRRSHPINPVDAVKTVSDAQDLADIIIRNTTLNKHMGDQVWETSERQLLTALIMDAATRGGNLAGVRAAVASGRKQLKAILEASPPGKGRDEALAMFSLSTEGFLNGVMVGLMVRLGPWLNPTVAALTSRTGVDLAALEDQLFSYYLCVPSGARQLKPVAAVILNFLLDRVLDQLRKSDTLKRPTMMLLDELTNFGYIPDLATQLTIMRHAHIPIVLGMQDVEQLRSVYGASDANIIFSQPATRIFFKPNELGTAREISNQLGQGTKLDADRLNLYPRKLLAPEEVLTLDSDRAICFLPAGPPVQILKVKPGSYESLAGPPPLPEAVDVDDLLIRQSKTDAEMVSQAQAEFPELLKEPSSEAEASHLLAKQNKKLRDKYGKYSRSRAKEMIDKWRRGHKQDGQ